MPKFEGKDVNFQGGQGKIPGSYDKINWKSNRIFKKIIKNKTTDKTNEMKIK